MAQPKIEEWDVARAMQLYRMVGDKKKIVHFTSLEIAGRMNLQVFQITARLASMEKKGITVRKDKLWGLTRDGWKFAAGPRPVRVVKVVTESGSLIPDDSDVPEIHSNGQWKLFYIWISSSRAEERVDVYVNEEGDRYVRAGSMEPADLIWRSKIHPEWKLRLRRVENSDKAQRIYRELERLEDRYADQAS